MMEGLISFIRRQVGLRTDAADAAGSVHAKLKDIRNNINKFISIVSDNIRVSADSEKICTVTGTIIARQFIIPHAGAIRIKADARTLSIGANVLFYINSSSVFTSANLSSSYQSFSYDTFVNAGDRVSIRLSSGMENNSVAVKNCRLCFDLVEANYGYVEI